MLTLVYITDDVQSDIMSTVVPDLLQRQVQNSVDISTTNVDRDIL